MKTYYMRESIGKSAKIADVVIANKKNTYLDHEQDP